MSKLHIIKVTLWFYLKYRKIKLLSSKRHGAEYSLLGKGNASYRAAYQPTGKLCPSCGSIISLTTWTQLQQDWGLILNDIFGGSKNVCVYFFQSVVEILANHQLQPAIRVSRSIKLELRNEAVTGLFQDLKCHQKLSQDNGQKEKQIWIWWVGH